MPLKDVTPVIDDRNWQNIVDEIRSRIPHYTAEWTDLNENDIGITFAQVFAHLAEMLLFRMARVPDLAYIKFLELIGIELTPAQPAKAEVTFVVADTEMTPTVLVPPHTQVSAAGDEGPPIVFETERALTALACKLLAVQVDDGAQFRDVTAANENAAAGFDPLGADPQVGAALVLGFGFADGHPNQESFPAIAIDLAVWTQQDPRAPLVQHCTAATTRAYAAARLQWEGWNGTMWVRLDALTDETLAFTRSGHMVVRVPGNAALARAFLGDYEELNQDTGEEQPPLFWIRARLTETQYEMAPRLLAVRINTAPAIQAQTVRDEVLGGTSGERNQRFGFGNRPLLKLKDSPPVIEIDQGQGPEVWQVVDDFLGSGPRDKHVVINWAAGEVFVGDGENGAVPVANASNPDANVIAREYRYGGGARGNIAARAINNVLTPVAGLDTGATFNLFAANSGADEESLDSARKRAPLALRARERAVTVEDFELLAQAAGNVKRAKTLPLAHPQFPGVKVPGAVTVIVVPDRRKPEVPALGTAPPLPSDGLLRTVCEYLDARRLLTTELFVVAPRYVTVEVTAQVVVTDEADTRAVKEAVELKLRTYFDPLLGGDDGAGWPFGGALRYSKIVQRIFAVEGVDSVPELKLVVDGDEHPVCSDVSLEAIAPNALVNLTAHEIEVVTLREVEDEAIA